MGKIKDCLILFGALIAIFVLTLSQFEDMAYAVITFLVLAGVAIHTFIKDGGKLVKTKDSKKLEEISKQSYLYVLYFVIIGLLGAAAFFLGEQSNTLIIIVGITVFLVFLFLRFKTYLNRQ